MWTSQHISILHDTLQHCKKGKTNENKTTIVLIPGTAAAAVGRIEEEGGAMSKPLTRLL